VLEVSATNCPQSDRCALDRGTESTIRIAFKPGKQFFFFSNLIFLNI
jgi:hypothetical protein